MIKRKVIAVIIFIISLYLLSPNIAFAFRCEGGQIEIGDPTGEVLIKCGEPHTRSVVGKKQDEIQAAVPGGVVGEEAHKIIEQWVYIDIPYHHNRYVIMTFKAGKLILHSTVVGLQYHENIITSNSYRMSGKSCSAYKFMGLNRSF